MRMKKNYKILARISLVFILLFFGKLAFLTLHATTCAEAQLISSLPYNASVVCTGLNDITSSNAAVCSPVSSAYYGGQEALMTYTPTSSGNITINYSGQSWTAIIVYAGCPTAGGTCVGGISSSATSKLLTVSLTAGVQYYIMIDTWPSPASPCPGTVSITAAAPPLVNDNCSGALPLTCGVTVTGSTATATADAVPTCVTTLNTAPGVWYKLDNVTGNVTLSLCGSSYDTKMGVFTGTCASPVCVTGNDDFCSLQSQVTFTATLGTTYYVLVTGFSTNSGAFTLVPTCTQIVDPCSSIATTTCGTANTATLSGAGVWSPTANCGFTTPGTEKVYSFVATNSGPYTLQVTSTNSGGYVDYFLKAASGGCSSTGWSCIGDVFSPTTKSMGTLTAGTTYYILMDAETTASVTQTFQINCPAFDPCVGITTMSCGTNYTATPSGSGIWSPLSCGFSTPGKETIYSFTPSTTGVYSLTVSAATGGYVDYFYKAASGGCNSTGWTCIKDISLPSTWSMGTLTAGVQYYVLLDPESTGAYSHTFQIACVGASPPPCVASPNSPLNGQSGICPSTTQTLSWSTSLGATSYDVYFGTSPTPPFVGNTTSTSFLASTPTQGTYYWQIRPVGPGGTASGCTIWSFSKTDVTPPTITCPAPITVTCAALVPPVNTGSVTATDNCGVASITFVSDAISAQTCSNKYTLTRTYRATDVNGNSSTCSQIITVNDATAPSITCPVGASYTCASQVPAANTALVSASDNCTGAVTVSFVGDVISNQVCANKYTLTRTYRATDVCGNSSTCSQVITVNDNVSPVLSGVPNNVTIECTQPIPTLPNISATDNCSGTVNITFKESSTKSDYLTLCNAYSYTITRTWTAIDVCGNTSSRAQTIKVQDTKPPVFTSKPPQFITVECDEDGSNNVDPIAEDACDSDPSVILDIKYKFGLNGCVGNYLATYTWTAGDKCGNTSQFTQYITVVDTEAPEIKCPQNIEVSSEIPIAVSWQQPKANDYCDGLIITVQIQGPPPGSIFQPGTQTTIVYSATDKCGNVSTCSFIVKIRSGGGTLEVDDQTKFVNNETVAPQQGKTASGRQNALYQNEPNPFENATNIRFYLEKPSYGTINILDLTGKIVKTFEGEYPAGENRVQLDNSQLPANGMYYYQLRTRDFNDTKKMMYIK